MLRTYRVWIDGQDPTLDPGVDVHARTQDRACQLAEASFQRVVCYVVEIPPEGYLGIVAGEITDAGQYWRSDVTGHC